MSRDGGLQRKKINTDDHVSMCNCSGGTELDKAVKFRISRSAWCTFSRVEQIRGFVPRENEHQGAHFRGWCTNSLANLCAGARLRGGNEYAVTPDSNRGPFDPKSNAVTDWPLRLLSVDSTFANRSIIHVEG